MQIAARLPWSALGSGALLEAHVRGAVPAPLRLPGVRDLLRLAARPAFADELRVSLQRDMDASLAGRLDAFADPRALAVVTGQQPGCAGGAILVLLKAATAVALARRATRVLGRPVLPVFWNATDDVDFDEVARVGWPTPAGELLFLELPAAARRAQGLVGDLPAAGDTAAAAAAVSLLDASARTVLTAWLPQTARDHGEWVARLLAAVFPDLAVIDARAPVLRSAARPLFARYLDTTVAASAAIESRTAALAAQGFARTLSAESARQGLFLVDGGQRHKVNGDLTPLRQALARTPAAVAPNVVLRPLVQDLLLPVVASVVGPAEIGYLHEIHALRAQLGVPETAVVPRLGMTLVDAATWESALRLGIAAQDLIKGEEAPLRAAARRRAAPLVRRAQDVLAGAASALAAVEAQAAPGALQRPLRRFAALEEEFVRRLEDVELERLFQEEPGLRRAAQRLRPRGKPQERIWAALWLLGRWGSETGERLLRLADTHLDALERGEAAHCIVLD